MNRFWASLRDLEYHRHWRAHSHYSIITYLDNQEGWTISSTAALHCIVKWTMGTWKRQGRGFYIFNPKIFCHNFAFSAPSCARSCAPFFCCLITSLMLRWSVRMGTLTLSCSTVTYVVFPSTDVMLPRINAIDLPCCTTWAFIRTTVPVVLSILATYSCATDLT